MTSRSPNVVMECARGVSENGGTSASAHHQQETQANQQQQPPLSSQSFSYVLLQLQRPNCTIPWGLSLTLFEEQYLVVGDVNNNNEVLLHLKNNHEQQQQQQMLMVQTCWSTRACPVNPSLFWSTTTTPPLPATTTTTTNSNSSTIAQILGQGGGADGSSCHSSSSSSASCLSPSHVASFVQHLVTTFPYCPQTVHSILPGDCILAINGKTVAGNYTTLSQATAFLQAQTHLFLIILRLQQQRDASYSSSSSLGHYYNGHLLHHHPAVAAAVSPTSTLHFPMQQQQQQQQQQHSEESSIFQTAQEAWHALRLLNHNHHHIVYPSITPPPPTSSSSLSSSSCCDDSWSAADALLCLRGGNNNSAISAVRLQQQQQQQNHANSNSSTVMAFSTPLYPSMGTTPLAIWSPPLSPPPRPMTTNNTLDCVFSSSFFSSYPPPTVVGGNNIYSSYSTLCVVPSSTQPQPQTTLHQHHHHHHHHHRPSGRDFSRPILHWNPLFREQVNTNKPVIPAAQNNNINYSFGEGAHSGSSRLLLPYEDDWEDEPDEGQRAHLFLKPIDNSSPETFGRWLQQRKGKWRQRYTVHNKNTLRPPPPVTALPDLPCSKMVEGGGFVLYRNPLFGENPKNDKNMIHSEDEEDSKTSTAAAARCTALFFGPTSGLPYDDDLEFEPDDGQRAKFFLKPIDTSSPYSFGCWLKQRKRKWRQSYKVYPLETNNLVEDDESSSSPSLPSLLSSTEEEDFAATVRNELSVPVDFWSSQGHVSFQHWLSASKSRWKCSYSWNQRKRQRIQEDCNQVVRLISPLHHHHRIGDDDDKRNNNINNDNFAQWLRVRKNQWRVLRRKRQRERIMEQSKHQRDQHKHDLLTAQHSVCSDSTVKKNTATWDTSSPTSAREICQQLHQPSFQSDELIAIDALLEDQERERERLTKETHKPLDISFIFDSALDCPDDVVVHCFQYLDPMEHCKLLCLNHETRQTLSKRDDVWRQLCPTTWQLPRRPRKPWHVLYLTKLRTETERARKRCDDLLARASNILLKGDQIHAIEKLCAKAEQAVAMPFDVNYSSGVVCERNSLLNLAVIHQRHKVVRWLVETMKADIETYDRGGFTPLLNAAWAGDKFLVRYFLAAGANRSHIGTCHYTKPLAAPDFAGLNAAGWARKQGHDGIAKLIELGL